MMETVFVQLGTTLVNISKVQFFKPTSSPHKSLMFVEGRADWVELDISFENIQKALAETYQQMAMMQAAASKAYGSQGGLH